MLCQRSTELCHGRAGPCARWFSAHAASGEGQKRNPLRLLAQAHAITTRYRTRDVDMDECANAPCPCGRWERQHSRSALAAFRATHDALNTPKITVQETKRI
jgi:hypothetical protein